MSALIDTNVFIDFLRGKPAAAAVLNGFASKPSTSAITLAELVAGALSQRAEREIESLLADVAILPTSAEIARRAGAWKRLDAPSHGVGLADALVAATAENHGLPLATLNVKHFPMFRKLKPAY